MLLFPDPAFATRCLELGAQFHLTLDRRLAGGVDHEIDPEHDRQVGQALFLTTFYNAPQLAADLYNQWAQGAGFAPITYIGTMTGADGAVSYLVNIVTAILRIGADCQVQDVHDLRASAPAGGMVEAPVAPGLAGVDA